MRMVLVLFLCGVMSFVSGTPAFCAPDPRTVLVAGFFSSSGEAASPPLRDRIVSLIRAEKRLVLLNDRPDAVPSDVSLPGLSSDESLRRLCERSGAAWVLFGVAGGESACRVYLYDYSRGMVHLFHEESSSAEGLAQEFVPDLARIFYLISSADGFFLHPSPLVYVRDIADYGFTGDRVGLNYPCGLFVKGSGLLCAASGTVVEWDCEGRAASHYGRRGSGAGEYISSMKAAADSEGNVYVSDMSGKVIRYPVKGKPTETALERVPSFFAVSGSGTLFVCDRGEGRVRLYDGKGTAAGEIPLPDETLYAMVRGGEDVLLLVSRGERIVLKRFSPSGAPLQERVLPLKEDDAVIGSFCEDMEKNLYLLDIGSRAIVKISREGNITWVSPFGWAGPSGQMGNPFDLAVSADGRRLFVADSSNRRIVVFGEFAETLAASVPESDRIADEDRRLASLGEILRKDPMSEAAVGRYIDHYAAIGAYHQALELCRRYAASLPQAQKRADSIAAALYLRDADGFASLFEEAAKAKDSASADFYFEQSAMLYDRAFAASGDRMMNEKKAKLVKRRTELLPTQKKTNGEGLK